MKKNRTISSSQCRSARALLAINQQDLADLADVAKQTLADFERGARTPHRRTLRDIVEALEKADVEFINDGEHSTAGGIGVRLKKPPVGS